MSKDAQCSCPHMYKENGLVRHGTDYKCPVHGKRAAPDEAGALRDLLACTNGAIIGLVQELEKSGHRMNGCRDIVRANCAKLGTNNPLEE
jgi:hypothetical protein